MRILIVEYDKATCDLYQMLFRNRGHSIAESSDSQKAMELIAQSQLESNPFDVLITNQRISGTLKNGCELIQWAKERVGFIIMATGTDCEAEALAAGADKFFLVPVSNDVLRKAVEVDPLLKFA